MQVLYSCCAGVDVHKKSLTACLRFSDERAETRTFATTTAALLELLDWLRQAGVHCVAMESTGVYWKPVFNILATALEVMVVNAQHVKQVPGRKTDVKDCQWLAQLLQVGLLRGSFVPAEPIQDLRDLTRQRTQYVAEKARTANRLQKVLEDANIKLASVVTDIVGASSRAMIRSLIAGETDVVQMANLAQKSLRKKIPALQEALHGRVTAHHRFMLQMHLDHIEHVERLVERLSQRITEIIAPFFATVELLKTIPGVKQTAAEVLVAETGGDMQAFPTAEHLASWAGLCPGNNESAGKRRSGRPTHGNRWLKGALVQAGWAASHTKDTYLRSCYYRIAKRAGAKRAAFALGHRLLRIAYHVVRTGKAYEDLGPNHLDLRTPDRLTRHLVRRLESLGHKVTLNKDTDAA